MGHIKEAGPTGVLEFERWCREREQQIRPLVNQLMACERAIILEAIELCQGDKSKAAAKLGISRTKLYRRLDIKLD